MHMQIMFVRTCGVNAATSGFKSGFFFNGAINLGIQIAQSVGNMIILADVQGKAGRQMFGVAVILYVLNFHRFQFFLLFTFQQIVFVRFAVLNWIFAAYFL